MPSTCRKLCIHSIASLALICPDLLQSSRCRRSTSKRSRLTREYHQSLNPCAKSTSLELSFETLGYLFNATNKKKLSHAQNDGFGCFWFVEIWSFNHLCIITTSTYIYHVMSRRGRCLLFPVVACVHLRAFMGNGLRSIGCTRRNQRNPAVLQQAGLILSSWALVSFQWHFPIGKSDKIVRIHPNVTINGSYKLSTDGWFILMLSLWIYSFTDKCHICYQHLGASTWFYMSLPSIFVRFPAHSKVHNRWRAATWLWPMATASPGVGIWKVAGESPSKRSHRGSIRREGLRSGQGDVGGWTRRCWESVNLRKNWIRLQTCWVISWLWSIFTILLSLYAYVNMIYK